MATPIQPTPILKGKDAENFINDLEEVDRLMQKPEYRKRVLANLERCYKLYMSFESRRIP